MKDSYERDAYTMIENSAIVVTQDSPHSQNMLISTFSLLLTKYRRNILFRVCVIIHQHIHLSCLWCKRRKRKGLAPFFIPMRNTMRTLIWAFLYVRHTSMSDAFSQKENIGRETTMFGLGYIHTIYCIYMNIPSKIKSYIFFDYCTWILVFNQSVVR